MEIGRVEEEGEWRGGGRGRESTCESEWKERKTSKEERMKTLERGKEER